MFVGFSYSRWKNRPSRECDHVSLWWLHFTEDSNVLLEGWDPLLWQLRSLRSHSAVSVSAQRSPSLQCCCSPACWQEASAGAASLTWGKEPNHNSAAQGCHRICKQLTLLYLSWRQHYPMCKHNQLMHQAPGLENVWYGPSKTPFF